MKTIEPFHNLMPIVHVTELPLFDNPYFEFGFAIGRFQEFPTVRIRIVFYSSNKENKIKIVTYEGTYKISGEGLILEDHIYTTCRHALHAMKILLQHDKICRSIPQSFFQLQGKEVFGDDLIQTAKELNAIDGKRGFPV